MCYFPHFIDEKITRCRQLSVMTHNNGDKCNKSEFTTQYGTNSLQLIIVKSKQQGTYVSKLRMLHKKVGRKTWLK